MDYNWGYNSNKNKLILIPVYRNRTKEINYSSLDNDVISVDLFVDASEPSKNLNSYKLSLETAAKCQPDRPLGSNESCD